MEESSIVAENVIDNNKSTLLVNSKTASKLNPGDIRKLLSTPIKVNPPRTLRQLRGFPAKQTKN